MSNDWFEFEIKGLDQLQEKLEKLPENLARKGLRDSVKAGAQEIKDEMVALAPRDTGFLAEHFGVRTNVRIDDLAASAYVGPDGKMDYPDEGGGYRQKKDRKGKLRNVGRIAVVSVARFLEFGTHKMAARPFMTPAFENKKAGALDAIIEKLKSALEDSAKE